MFGPLVENGYTYTDNPVTTLIAKEYVSKLKEFNPDVIILGCTHYPIIKDTVKKCAEKIIGDVEIVDSGSAAAYAVKDYLENNGLINNSGGKTSYFVSDRPNDFGKLASVFLEEPVSDVTKIDIEKYFYHN
jgi:glutamate racemase